jgi:hypothetical protein
MVDNCTSNGRQQWVRQTKECVYQDDRFNTLAPEFHVTLLFD